MSNFWSGYSGEQDGGIDRLITSSIDLPFSYKDLGDIPEVIDPWILDEDLLPVENQGQIGSCFPAGTMVTLSNGRLIPIEDVKFGMEVLSHLRNKRMVVATMSRKFSGQMVTLHAKGWAPVQMTNDHVLIVKRDGVEKWVRADEVLDTDLLLLSAGVKSEQTANPVVDVSRYQSDTVVYEDNGVLRSKCASNEMPQFIDIDELAAWCIGLYVAEGSTDYSANGTPCRAIWSLHVKETEYAAKLGQWFDRLGISYTCDPKKDSLALNVRASCGILANFLSTACGRFCNHKQVPHFIMQANDTVKTAFLRGYMDGDGSVRDRLQESRSKNSDLVTVKRSLQCCISTASKVLYQQFSSLCISLGLKPGLSVKAKNTRQNYDSHTVYLYGKDAKFACPEMELSYEPFEGVRDNCEKGQWRKIRSIVKQDVQDVMVYDFTVDVDHSFIADGLAVHNCQGASLSECAEYCYYVATGGQKKQLSMMFAYLGSQRYDGINGDQGSTLEGGTKLIKTDGICSAATVPYPSSYPRSGWKSLPEAAWQEAKSLRLANHVNIDSWDKAISFLAGGLGIIHIGIAWGNFMEPDSYGCIDNARVGGNFGGHAIVLCGYAPDSVVGRPSPENRRLILKNSWDRRWGKNGRAYISKKTFDNLRAHNFTVMIGRTDAIVPDPRPLPSKFLNPKTWRYA